MIKHVRRDETYPIVPESPYVRSNAVIEDAMHDWIDSGNWRRFRGVSKVTVECRKALDVLGDGYDARERDYIHAIDFARAHLTALVYGFGKNGAGYDLLRDGADRQRA